MSSDEPVDPFAHGDTRAPALKAGNSNTAMVIAIILVVGIVALGGLGLAGWWVWNSVNDGDYGGTVISNSDVDDSPAGDPGEDWHSSQLTDQAPDLESWDAVPGDTFEFKSSEPVRVGEALASGFYVASPEALCSWQVQAHEDLGVETHFVRGNSREAEALVVLPHNYLFESHGCGTWTAIDPATVLEGPREEVLAEGVSYVGRGVAPGAYKLAPVAGFNGCWVAVSDAWGFVGPAIETPVMWASSGTLVFHVELGDTVRLDGCPDATMVDVDQLLAQDQGATSIIDGTWLVGVDVQSGTYVGAEEFSDTTEWCMLGVWGDALTYQGDAEKAWHEYGAGDDPVEVTLEPGEVIESIGCGKWARSGS